MWKDFEEDELLSGAPYTPHTHARIVRRLFVRKIVRDERHAERILLAVVLVSIVLVVLFWYVSVSHPYSSSPAAATNFIHHGI
jgi:hypothetical protein